MASVLLSQNIFFQKYPSVINSERSKCFKVHMSATVPTIFKEPSQEKKPLGLPNYPRPKGNHQLVKEKIEILESLEDWARDNVLRHLKPVEKCWQPINFLPDTTSDYFLDRVQDIRDRAKELPDDYFVTLVGDMITEEALPTYQSFLNTKDGIKDETGSSPSPWAIWIRGWTAEENRHGDLLNKYLYLCGRVDMKQIERTIQYLIGSGMDVHCGNDPYLTFIYASFQERATFISHGNTARIAKHYGDDNLAKICGIIASDEKRHEMAYVESMGKLFEIDPDGSVRAFAYMMQKRITMPAHWMYDGHDKNLYKHFSAVAQRLGVYTGKHYTEILEHLVEKWNVKNLVGLSSEGREAQTYLCELGSRFRRLEERSTQMKIKEEHIVPFSWIFNKPVKL